MSFADTPQLNQRRSRVTHRAGRIIARFLEKASKNCGNISGEIYPLILRRGTFKYLPLFQSTLGSSSLILSHEKYYIIFMSQIRSLLSSSSFLQTSP